MIDDMKEKKMEYSEKYFNGCKAKELHEMEYVTPKGHDVHCLICRKHNRYLGSLLILTVDGEETMQFIQGMPKIHYLDNHYHMLKGETNRFYDVYEKLDGTNICLYGLKNSEGETIEIVAKTRNMPILDKEFKKLYDLTDHYLFEKHIMENPEHTLFLELYGMGNPHGIKHIETYLDLKLLGGYDGEKFIDDDRLNMISNRRPSQLFRIYCMDNTYYVNTIGLSLRFDGYADVHSGKCDNIEECVNYIKSSLEKLNDEYDKHNKRFAIEGCVINGKNLNDKFMFIKVKPDTIELAHKSQNGIPKQYIMKEIMKYLDEHKSTALETWKENPDEIIGYINDNLRESFEQPFIDNSQGKIKTLFDEKVNPKPTPEELKVIGDKLIKEYPDRSVKDLMRVFGQEYPDMKKVGGKLYRYLEVQKK